jgi:peptidoglycan/LPS O-acetylase OafA/YrhL
MIMVVSAAFIVSGYSIHGAESLGHEAGSYFYGFARVSFGFCAGVMTYGWRDAFRIKMEIWTAFILATALLIGSFRFSGTYLNIGYTLVLYPFIVLFLAQYQHQGRLMSWLGGMSYPLYVLHLPILLAVSAVWQIFGQVNASVVAAIGVVAALAFSHLAMKIDEPLRRYLRVRLLPPRVPIQPLPGEVLPRPLR